jgi:single-stranded DNA-binding protein
MTFASITLSGTLKNKAEQRFTANNVSVVSFTMEIERYDSKAKEVKRYPVKANLWGDAHAEYLERLNPGTEVLLIGRPQIDQFNDRDGNVQKVFTVEVSKINLLGASSADSADYASTASRSKSSSLTSDLSEEDMEIPF